MSYKSRKAILEAIHHKTGKETDVQNFYMRNREYYKEIFNILEHKEIRSFNRVDERCISLLIKLDDDKFIRAFNSNSYKDILELGKRITKLSLSHEDKKYFLDKIKYEVALELERNFTLMGDKYMEFILTAIDSNIDLNSKEVNYLTQKMNEKLQKNIDRSLEFFGNALNMRRTLIDEGELNDNNENFTIEEIVEITDDGFYECLN